jgi:hypothetical protein
MNVYPEVCHPSQFPQLFGLKSVPRAGLLALWKLRGFPESLAVPNGHYRTADVLAWLRAQPTRSEAGQKKRGPKPGTGSRPAKKAKG